MLKNQCTCGSQVAEFKLFLTLYRASFFVTSTFPIKQYISGTKGSELTIFHQNLSTNDCETNFLKIHSKPKQYRHHLCVTVTSFPDWICFQEIKDSISRLFRLLRNLMFPIWADNDKGPTRRHTLSVWNRRYRAGSRGNTMFLS